MPFDFEASSLLAVLRISPSYEALDGRQRKAKWGKSGGKITTRSAPLLDALLPHGGLVGGEGGLDRAVLEGGEPAVLLDALGVGLGVEPYEHAADAAVEVAAGRPALGGGLHATTSKPRAAASLALVRTSFPSGVFAAL